VARLNVGGGDYEVAPLDLGRYDLDELGGQQ
jgi:hypothetical protein